MKTTFTDEESWTFFKSLLCKSKSKLLNIYPWQQFSLEVQLLGKSNLGARIKHFPSFVQDIYVGFLHYVNKVNTQTVTAHY